jgi:hypothetical protein
MLFSPFMPPHAVEECLPPRLPEMQALRGFLEITFPNWFKPAMDRNSLIALKNQMASAVEAAEKKLNEANDRRE